jgi:hypothetical protein
MKSLRNILLIAAVGLAQGCVVGSSEPDTVVVSGDGTLTVTWTVAGTSNPDECAFEGADSIDIRVQTTSGASVADANEVCEAGAASVDLPPGGYVADAVLLDAAGHVITTSVNLGHFTIRGDDELVVDTDFPSDSFY